MGAWLFITFGLWAYLGLRWLLNRRLRMGTRLDEAVRWGRRLDSIQVEAKAQRESLTRRLAQQMGNRLAGKQTGSRLARLQLKLAQAGSPMRMTAKEWLGIRLLTMLCGTVVGGAIVTSSGMTLSSVLFCVVLIMASWVGPDFWLSRRSTQRQADILRQLPNALDLLTVSVEAGLGFDQALDRLGQRLQGPLAAEFGRALREIQLGSARSIALQRLAARTGVDSVRTFISAVVQSEKLGVGMAQVLRVQAAEVRRKRRMNAQERAMKAPIKMLFPLILFVFPALFIVVLGPALLHMIQIFHK